MGLILTVGLISDGNENSRIDCYAERRRDIDEK